MFDFILKNQMFIGLVGATVTGSLLYLLRAVPNFIWSKVKSGLTVSVTVTSRHQIFEWVVEWLARHDYTRTTRRLRLDEGIEGVSGGWRFAPDYGTHLLWESRVPFLVHRTIDEPKNGGTTQQITFGPLTETITITTLGRSQKRIRDLVTSIAALVERRERIEIRVWQGSWWSPIASKLKRSMNTVYMPQKMKTEMLEDADWFFKAGEWFGARGVPYRMGWLLDGPPGTGKTSFVKAIAGHFDRPIYYLNLSTVSDDNALLRAFTDAPPRCILLIEDIDRAGASARKQTEPAVNTAVVEGSVDASPGAAKKPEPQGITASGLLNAIDGVASSDGRLLIMTTNHPEALDPAIIRPGRIDRKWTFGPLEPKQVTEMLGTFFGDSFASQTICVPMKTAGEWQKIMMEHRDNPEAVVASLQATQPSPGMAAE